jgi:prepilin-type N-terminal cleavage/methylation domain-containing protein
VSRQQRGFTLIEFLIVVAIVGLMIAITIPSFGRMRRRMALQAAAAELRTQFHQVRSRAITRNAYCALKFLMLAGEWHFAVYEDGDGDGVRNDDIKSGTDRLIARPRVVLPTSRAVSIGLLDIAIKDPDGDLLSPSKSPVVFGTSTICSFSPLGQSTPGTIYLTDRGFDLYAVRVFGTSAKIRVLRFFRDTGKWENL